MLQFQASQWLKQEKVSGNYTKGLDLRYRAWGQEEGPVCKGACHQSWWPGFYPINHKVEREQILQVIFYFQMYNGMCAPSHTHT